MTDKKLFKIVARHTRSPSSIWREELVELLGAKPRRLSQWCELGLWGLIHCVHSDIDQKIRSDAIIRVISQASTKNATERALAQSIDFPPMPFTFMQSQPGQFFSALANVFEWRGDAQVMTLSNLGLDLGLSLRSIGEPCLLGVVDDTPRLCSFWLSLLPTDHLVRPELEQFDSLSSLFDLPVSAQYLCIDSRNNLFYC
ncbi:hypothetical protein [Simiduia aestuariiviva]|uniref:Uncharacterized protein n=1 Tax=Simiduia aestuariiviva TaxID=1510459 RepID=A0A839UKG1_9GAMM|nr:hypothetical protein [Simiduia aestuariiviva]MBB3168332.1 hypothetical protein [Simiduia aestuariiviva]